MARVLLLPHAPTSGLAHVGACLAVGTELRARGHEVTMTYGGSRPDVIEAEGFSWEPVPEISPEREWDPSRWFASSAQLRSIVEAHAGIIGRTRADVAVSSGGVAGRLACELAGLPHLHLMHYLATSSYGRGPVVWRNRARDARHPRRALGVGRAHLRRLRARAVSGTPPGVVAQARAEFGLPPARREDAGGCRDTIVALTTTPFIDPAADLPAQWRYVGPVVWSASGKAGELPVRRGGRPLVYVTQGSTGDPALLRLAVAELAAEPVDVLVTTGGLCEVAELERLGPNITAAALLPGDACLERADAAVIHGGHLTFCEALRAGTPFVVLPYRRDQIARVNRAERLGVGIGVWPRPLRRGVVRRAVRRLLERPRYRARCEELGHRLRDEWDGRRNAADLVERELAGGD
jgi:MGT family glycosyltransferase